MDKSYNFNIEDCTYNVDIKNNIAIITDSKGNKICNEIEIADTYINNEKLIEGLVKLNINCNNKINESNKLMQEALEYLGLK